MSKPKISIIIPVRQTVKDHRDVERLDRCIRSLVDQGKPGRFEVIVSDTDSSAFYKKSHAAICKAHSVKYIFTRTGLPWNISRARNIGIRAARGEFVMVTDMDCIFAPGFLDVVLKYADEDSIVHCRISDLPERFPAPLDAWKAMASAAVMRPAWCYGGCQVVSRKWAEAVHGYDERFILWGADDNDFFERAVQSGKRSIWIEAEATYFHQWHPQDNRTADIAQKEKNRARLRLTEAKKLPIIRNPHEWGWEKESDKWSDTAIIVTAFMREKSLLRTIESARLLYPTVDIIIADNGNPSKQKEEWAEIYGCEIVQVPFDSGVTVARNAGVKALKRRHKYVVIVEDDIGFGSCSDLSKWKKILDSDPALGIAGGQLQVVTDFGGDSIQSYEAELSIGASDRTLYLKKIEKPEWKKHKGIDYHLADIVLNVFMAKRETLDAVQWDENIKSAPEHCDFFFSLKYRSGDLVPKRVAFVPSVSLIHYRDAAGMLDNNYRSYRTRPGAFAYFGKKWSVDFFWNSWNPKWGIPNPTVLATYAESSTASRKSIFQSAAVVFDKMGVKWWLEAGTCLGAIRDHDFIAHDPDIDIGVWTENAVAFANDLSVKMLEAGFAEYKRWQHEGRIIEISFTKADSKVDVFLFYERNGLAWHGAFGPANDNGSGDYDRFLPHVFTRRLFDELKPIEFCGLTVNVPNPPEQYLRERYGAGWETPDREYKYWKDCRSIAPKFLSPKATTFISGTWDIFHYGHLNILERCCAIGKNVIVGVLSDAAAGADHVITPQAERLRIIKSLRCVSEAFIQDDIDPTADIKGMHEVDYLAHGDDVDSILGSDAVRERGGIPILLPHTKGISASLIRMAQGESVKKPKRFDSGATIAVGIKTFMREKTLSRTLQALHGNITSKFRLYICDDSGKKSDRKLAMYQDLKKRGAVIIDKPFDSGISAGRNAIIKALAEPLILITDDDVMLDDQAALDRMLAVLEARPDVGLVAALIHHEKGGAFASAGYARGLRLERQGGLLKRTPCKSSYERAPMRGGGDALYLVADQVPNCFLARAEVFESLRWDDRIKVEFEHMDFFLRMKAEGKWKAAVAVEAEATHFLSEADLEYERARRSGSAAYFKQKHGIENIVSQF